MPLSSSSWSSAPPIVPRPCAHDPTVNWARQPWEGKRGHCCYHRPTKPWVVDRANDDRCCYHVAAERTPKTVSRTETARTTWNDHCFANNHRFPAWTNCDWAEVARQRHGRSQCRAE
jgi:hypothetical protein